MMTPLILERGSASRLSGQWRDDDYDVVENGVVVGRIFKVPVAPQDRPWMWASGHGGPAPLQLLICLPPPCRKNRLQRGN